MIELRYYQKEAIQAIVEDYKEVDRTLIVSATGTGKTLTFNSLAKKYADEGKKVLILAHRGELLSQAEEKYRMIDEDVEIAFEQGTNRAHDTEHNVIIASVQSLYREERLKKYPNNFFDLIIVDEAHHAMADTYQTIFNYFLTAKVLGVTATPSRADKKELSDFFEKVSYTYTIRNGIEDSYLSKINVLYVPINFDLDRVKITTSDFDRRDVEKLLNPKIKEIIKSIKKYASDRKILMFMPRIESSQIMVEALKAAGFSAAHIDGKSKDRKQILQDYSDDKYQILVNSSLLLEGYDEPSIDCVINLRPTRSQTLYSQIIGRGTRIAPDKENLLILEYGWKSSRHQIANAFNLIEEDDIIASLAMGYVAGNTGTQYDIIDIVDTAREDAIGIFFGRIEKHVKQQLKRTDRLVDRQAFAYMMGDIHMLMYEPVTKWEKYNASSKQQEWLRKLGVDPRGVALGEASIMLDALFTDKDETKYCTVRQARLLTSKIMKPGMMAVITFSEASKIIDEMANNKYRKWQLTKGAEQFIETRLLQFSEKVSLKKE